MPFLYRFFHKCRRHLILAAWRTKSARLSGLERREVDRARCAARLRTRGDGGEERFPGLAFAMSGENGREKGHREAGAQARSLPSRAAAEEVDAGME
jgi:hypothetical protein